MCLETIFDMYLACFTEGEIADKVGVHQDTINSKIQVLRKTYPSTNSVKLSHYDDDTFQIPLYTVWAFGKDTNGNVGKEAIYTKNTETVNTHNSIKNWFMPFGDSGLLTIRGTNGHNATRTNVHNSITLYQGALIGVVDFSKTDIDLKIGSLCYGNKT